MASRIARFQGNENYKDDHAGIFFELLFMMRGVDWYEEDQQKVLNGQFEQCNKRFLKTAFPFFGVDPLFDWIPILEKRFAALEHSEHAGAWKAKSKEAYAKRYTADVRNHLFELSVLGHFAQQKILEDTDCPPPDSNIQTNIDALVNINSKKIYVEATYTSQQLFDAPTKTGQVMHLPVNDMFEQAAYKVKKKAMMGKQLHLVKSAPSVLVLGRHPWGACEITAREGVKALFNNEGCEELSGVIIADSWKFQKSDVIPNACARFPLNSQEWSLLATGQKLLANQSVENVGE